MAHPIQDVLGNTSRFSSVSNCKYTIYPSRPLSSVIAKTLDQVSNVVFIVEAILNLLILIALTGVLLSKSFKCRDTAPVLYESVRTWLFASWAFVIWSLFFTAIFAQLLKRGVRKFWGDDAAASAKQIVEHMLLSDIKFDC